MIRIEQISICNVFVQICERSRMVGRLKKSLLPSLFDQIAPKRLAVKNSRGKPLRNFDKAIVA